MPLSALRHDWHSAWRALRLAPGFSLTAVATLALAVGATTGLFSVLYGVVLRPLPYPESNRLVAIQLEQEFAGRQRPVSATFSFTDVVDWPGPFASFELVTFTSSRSIPLTGANGSRSISVAYVTGSFFPLLGSSVALGRPLTSSDDLGVVISERLRQQEFPEAANAVGRSIRLDRRILTVVGVVHHSFQVPRPTTDAWLLSTKEARSSFANPRGGGFSAFARLKPGVAVAQAAAEAGAIVAAAKPDDRLSVRIAPLHGLVVGDVASTLWLLFMAVALVLVVACANVAILLLARGSERAHEMAVRQALGASRVRLASQVLIEVAILVAAGSAAGVALATALVRSVVPAAAALVPRLDAVRMDAPVLAFALATAAAAAITTGGLAAWRLTAPADVLKRTAASLANAPAARRARTSLVVAELVVSTVLMVGALLLGRSFANLMQTDIGIATDQVAAVLVDLSGGEARRPEELRAVLDRVLAEASALPGVTDVAATASLPPNAARLRFTMNRIDEAVGQPSNYMVDAVAVTPTFFSTLRVRLLRGRFFSDADAFDSPDVMLMSADTARALFGEGDPIGRTLTLPSLFGQPKTVRLVGVISNIKYNGLERPADGAIYRPFSQEPVGVMFVLAGTTGDPARLAVGPLARAIAGVDPSAVIMTTNTLDGMVADAAAQPRLRAFVLIAFAFTALTVAAVGLYSVMARSVASRSREMAVRKAVGAGRADIAALVLRESAVVTALGVGIGLGSAFALSRLLRHLLYGVAPEDPWSYVSAAAVLSIGAALAAYRPARRAAAVDPAVALRVE